MNEIPVEEPATPYKPVQDSCAESLANCRAIRCPYGVERYKFPYAFAWIYFQQFVTGLFRTLDAMSAAVTILAAITLAQRERSATLS